MAFAFFRVASADSDAASDELNRFMASHAVIRVVCMEAKSRELLGAIWDL